MTADGKTNLEKVRRAWGEVPPEWVVILAEACDARASSQSAVAARLGISGAAVNQVLANSYIGRLDKIEARVRGSLMGQTVACPVLGEISKRKCLESQSPTRGATNELRVELRRACPRCPNYYRKTA
jgi:hypothetical protein